jgi:hypothetical protein
MLPAQPLQVRLPTRMPLRYGKILLRFTALAIRHPALLPALVAAAWRFRAAGWWRRAPFLPVPPRRYLEWRLHTAFGSADAVPTSRQLAAYLRWTRDALRDSGGEFQ